MYSYSRTFLHPRLPCPRHSRCSLNPQTQTKVIQILRNGNYKSLLKTINEKLVIAPSFSHLKGFIFTIFFNLKKISVTLEKGEKLGWIDNWNPLISIDN